MIGHYGPHLIYSMNEHVWNSWCQLGNASRAQLRPTTCLYYLFSSFSAIVARLILSNMVAVIHLICLLLKQKGPTQGHKKETQVIEVRAEKARCNLEVTFSRNLLGLGFLISSSPLTFFSPSFSSWAWEALHLPLMLQKRVKGRRMKVRRPILLGLASQHTRARTARKPACM